MASHPFRPGHRAPERHGPALWFVFRGRALLLPPGFVLDPVEGPHELEIEPIRSQFMGFYGELPCYSAEVHAEAEAPAGMDFHDLRALFARLEPGLHGLASRAVQIMDWDRSHQFCGGCGTPTEPSDSERSRRCPRCGLTSYPRLAPSMIVAVEREDEILLGRGPQFPPGIFSVLAGFVEPGESVEDTVRREVLEETAIETSDIRYFGSQPWPYPHSLMLGFQARYAGGDVTPDGVEILEAGFFSADDMPMVFPGKISIAQWLIHDFLDRHR